MSDDTPLPNYENPPVVEVSVGIQFAHSAVTTAHLGAFWGRVRDAYPVAIDAPGPILPSMEHESPFDQKFPQNLEAFSQPRVWLANSAGDHLLQLQRDRFVSNWKRVPGKPYPRFPNVYESFGKCFSDYEACCAEQGIKLVPNQFELTYINHIPEGEGWDAESGVGAVLGDDTSDARKLIGRPDVLDSRIGFPLPDHTGRLHLRIAIGRNNDTMKRLVLIEVTARGFQKERDRWYDLAHRAIVTRFAEVTSRDVQRDIWRRGN